MEPKSFEHHTKVGWGKTAALAAGLFAFGAFAFWLEYKHRPQTEEAATETKKPFHIKDTAVNLFRISNQGKDIEFKCVDADKGLCKTGDNSKWEITYPAKFRADDANTNSFLSSIHYLTATDIVDLKEDGPEKRKQLLHDFGLDAEALANPMISKLRVNTAQGEDVLYLGLNHPLGQSTYAVALRGNPTSEATSKIQSVLLIPNYFKSSLEKEVTYWRDKKIFTITPPDVEKFSIDSSSPGHGKISGVRADGNWTLTHQGQTFAGDPENIDTLLSGITFLSTKEFAADSKTDVKARALLAKSKRVLKISLGTAKTSVDIEIFQRTEGRAPAAKNFLYLTSSQSDALYELDWGGEKVSTLSRFDKQLKDLRLTKLITSVERFSAKRVEITSPAYGGKKIEAVNTDGKWITGIGSEPVDSDKLHSLLDRVSGNRIRDFVSGSAIPAGEAQGLTLRITTETPGAKSSTAKPQVERRIVLWRTSGQSADRLMARDLSSKRGEAEAMMLDPTLTEALPWSPDALKPAPATPVKK